MTASLLQLAKTVKNISPPNISDFAQVRMAVSSKCWMSRTEEPIVMGHSHLSRHESCHCHAHYSLPIAHFQLTILLLESPCSSVRSSVGYRKRLHHRYMHHTYMRASDMCIIHTGIRVKDQGTQIYASYIYV